MSMITSVNDNTRVIEHQYTVCTTQTVIDELHISVQYCPQISESCQNVCTRKCAGRSMLVYLQVALIYGHPYIESVNETNFQSIIQVKIEVEAY